MKKTRQVVKEYKTPKATIRKTTTVTVKPRKTKKRK